MLHNIEYYINAFSYNKMFVVAKQFLLTVAISYLTVAFLTVKDRKRGDERSGGQEKRGIETSSNDLHVYY